MGLSDILDLEILVWICGFVIYVFMSKVVRVGIYMFFLVLLLKRFLVKYFLVEKKKCILCRFWFLNNIFFKKVLKYFI